MIRPIDPEDLRRRTRLASPFPHVMIDGFLDPDFALRVHDAFPAYEEARKIGRAFNTVNEKRKVQVADPARFAPAILELNRILAAPGWVDLVAFIFDIPKLLPDNELIGGGIHQTGSRGRLDVHVDFNYIAERQLHRRLNILIYFNLDWLPEWGGNLELWDQAVKRCHQSFEPRFNRCLIFETSEISYHGVTAVQCPAGRTRKSFAAYYYTKEPPAHWNGKAHDTIFRSRPSEVIRGAVLMPAERAARNIQRSARKLRRGIKKILRRPPDRGST